MKNLSAELGVQSFCFRGSETNEQVIECVKAVGLNNIEICQKHIKFADESVFEDAIATYEAAGVGILSIGVQMLKGAVELEEKFFKFTQMAGCKYMSVAFPMPKIPECLKAADELAEKYDIRLGIHNHGGHHWLGNMDALKFVFNQTSDRVGLCLDTAWAIDAGVDPVKMVRAFGDRLYGVHFKDFLYSPERKHRDVIVGTGILDLPELMKALDDVGFDGYPILEFEGEVDNPVPSIRECVDSMRKVIEG